MQRQRMERLGIEGLDSILKGGVPERSIVLLEGTPGIGKEVIGYHFLFTGIKEGEACAIIFAGRTIDEIESEFAAYGMRIDRSFLTWIDASEAEPGTPPDENVISCSISELFTVSTAIKSFLKANKKRRMRIMFAILSPLLVSNNVQEVYKFFSSLISEFKKYDVTVLAMLEEGMHDPQTVISFEQLCDGVIDMKVYEHDWDVRTMLKIKKMRALPVPLKYFRFMISNRGFVLSE